MTPYQQHKRYWSGCERCCLCEHRKKVVLCRGRLPCDVLFIGEAPGMSEDVIGRPFVGPAGKLLDAIAEEALGDRSRAFTNLVACIPKDGELVKTGEPPKESIEACAPRLLELIEMANPKLFVAVGVLAGKWLPKIYKELPVDRTIQIVHPAAILRAEPVQQGILVQRAIVSLSNASQGI